MYVAQVSYSIVSEMNVHCGHEMSDIIFYTKRVFREEYLYYQRYLYTSGLFE